MALCRRDGPSDKAKELLRRGTSLFNTITWVSPQIFARYEYFVTQIKEAGY